MNKIITSTWFAVMLGGVVFVGTLVFFLKTQQGEMTQAGNAPAAGSETGDESTTASALPEMSLSIVAPASTTQIGSGPHTFNNPEVVKLLTELRLEKQALLVWEKELNELKRRLDVEMSELSFITQDMLQTKIGLEKLLRADQNHLRAEELNRLQNLARVYTNMPPANAVEIFKEIPLDEVAKIIHLMGERESAAILQAAEPTRAAEISERIRRITRPTSPNTPAPARR
jgi:flagellar motility protein MotE (MotC chaperone)